MTRDSDAPTAHAPEPRAAQTLAHLTEAGVLARTVSRAAMPPWVEVGPGDDAAVVRLPSARLVASTDTLSEGHDFLLEATRPAWIGRKAAVQNLADIAAMGARPSALVVAVTAPASTPVDVLRGISDGLAERAGRDGAAVVGGDLGAGDALSITVTALGSLPQGAAPILRSGAADGEVLAIGSPLLGRSAAGLAWILAGRADEAGAAELVAWHNAPDPDLALGWGTAPGRATAMIDLSDGLVRDGGRIAAASHAVLDLDGGALAGDAASLAAAAGELGADPWEWVLHGGEEHAMIATFAADLVPEGFRVIGRVRAPAPDEEPRMLLDGREIPREGFDHFA